MALLGASTRAFARLAQNTAQPLSSPLIVSRSCARWFSICRRHDTLLRASREKVQQHIRALEESRRRFTNGRIQRHGHIDPPKPGEELHVTFIDKDGDEHSFEVSKGDNLLDIAQANDLEMEGACGGSCACSTCHVIVQSEDMYDKIPEADDDEVRTA